MADLAEWWRRWEAGEIDKWDFYPATMGYSVTAIARVTGIPDRVIRDRRRYMRQLGYRPVTR